MCANLHRRHAVNADELPDSGEGASYFPSIAKGADRNSIRAREYRILRTLAFHASA